MKQKITLVQSWYCKLYDKLLRNERTPPIEVFFILFAYTHLVGQSQRAQNIYVLTILPIVLRLTLHINAMYLTASFIHLPNPIASMIIFLITLAISCNQKQKTYIFLYVVGDIFARKYVIHSTYLVIASGLFCWEIYSNLICRNIYDNRKCFIGFLSISALGIIQFMEYGLVNVHISRMLKISLICASYFFGDKLFAKRISTLKQLNIEHIKDSRILAHYLALIELQIRTNYKKYCQIYKHQKQCKSTLCFCHSHHKVDGHHFIRQLYENSIRQFPFCDDPLLYELYIDFLVRHGALIHALYFINQWRPSSFFALNCRLKCISSVNKVLTDLSTSNRHEKQYQYALRYDQLLVEMTMQICEVIGYKLVFWEQTTKQNPIMVKLQQEGLKIVDIMYNLNVSYNIIIKEYERTLLVFEATILYAMYLLSTTNFKDYAELIIKNTSKVMQEVNTLENFSQIHLLKCSVLKPNITHLKDSIREIQRKDSGNFNIFINNVSNNLCKLCEMEREQLIGSDLNHLVPNQYQPLYKKYIGYLLSFQREEIPQIVSLQQTLTPKVLPIRISQSKLLMVTTTLRIFVDYQDEVEVVALVNKLQNKSAHALISFQGQLKESEQGFKDQILAHSEIKRYIHQMNNRWSQQKRIVEEQFNVMMDSVNYFIVLSSPFAQLFQTHNCGLPPLHIEIINQSQPKNRQIYKGNASNVIQGIKDIQNVLNYDSQSSSSSSKNRSTSITVLSAFSQKNTVPIYSKIIVGFIFVITCCLVVSLVGYTSTNLAWDNIDTDNNPLNDSISFMKIEHISTFMLSNLMDIQEYYSNPNLNKTKINSYFGNRMNYTQTINLIFHNQFTNFKLYFYQCVQSPSPLLAKQMSERFAKQFPIYNMSVIPSNTSFQQQNNTFEQILRNYLIDFSLMSQGVFDNSITLPFAFAQEIVSNLQPKEFASVIDKSIQKSNLNNQILTICMAILIVIFIVPLFFFLRSRLPIHEKVFDLFASIEVETVTKQIKQLRYVRNIIENYSQSSQILKANLLGYTQNVIYPKNQSSKSSSSNNGIILGLQKFDMALQRQQLTGSQFQQRGKRSSRQNKVRKSLEFNADSLKELSELTKKLQKRKRAGDLNFAGSQSDPQSRFNLKHTILYLMALIFLVFLTLQGIAATSYAQTIKQKKNNLFNFADIYVSAQLNFLLAKVYFRMGDAGLSTIDPAYRLEYLKYTVQSTPTYDFVNRFAYDALYDNCTSTDKRLVCTYRYSYLTLIGEFGNLIKQLFEERYIADQNYNNYVSANNTQTYNQIISNVSQKVFYMQSILNQLEHIIYGLTEIIYSDMYSYSVDVGHYKLMVLIGSVSWWIVTVIVGTIFILGMKKQYFKEVYMLTFLNNYMLINNKRVESFIDSISKTSN